MVLSTDTGTGDAGRRLQQRSIDTRRRLIDAAIAAFAEAGYAGAATRDIAERAGVHHPLITYHFRNKLRLWQTAADRLFDELQSCLDEMLAAHADSPADQRLRTAIEVITLYSSRHPEWQHFVRDASASGSERDEWLTEKHLSRLFAALIPLLEELDHAGRLRGGDPAQICLALLAASGGIFSMAPAYERLTGRSLREAGSADACAQLINRLFVSESRA